ncbi:MAG: hypothetical protein RIT81_09010 [Deltaproteobacteria bacterium]
MKRVAVVALLTSACGASDVDAIGALPDDITFVAATWEDDAGTYLGGTPMVPYAPGVSLEAEVDRSASTLFVHGWTDADLGVVNMPTPEARAGSIVRNASGREPLLPEPSWIGEGAAADRTTALERRSVAPAPLTVDWLDACPLVLRPGERHFADVRCIPRPCLRGPAQSGCRLSVDVTECGIGGYEVELTETGDVRALEAEGEACRLGDPPPLGVFAFDCGSCRTDLYSIPEAELVPFDIETTTVAVQTTVDKLIDLRKTAAPALLVDGDVAIVATYAGASTREECAAGPRATDLVFYATETGARTVVRRVDGCLFVLERDPVGDGFVAVDYARGVRALVRFDANAQEIGRIDLDILVGPPPREPLDLAAFEDEGKLVLVAQAERVPAMIVFVTMQPFEISSHTMLPDRRGRVVEEGGGFAVVGQGGRVELWDVSRESYVQDLALGTGEGVSNDVDALAYFANGQTVVSASLNERGGVHQIDVDLNLASARFYLDERVPVRLAPMSASTAVVAVARPTPPFDVGLTIYDAQRARFLPRVVDIGHGPVADVAVDGTGRVWVLLASDGALIQARAR